MTLDDLVERESLSREGAAFLRVLMQLRSRIAISGEPGAGKTTLVAALLAAAPAGHCVRACEEIRELAVPITHGSYYEVRPPALDGTGEISLRDLVKFVLTKSGFQYYRCPRSTGELAGRRHAGSSRSGPGAERYLRRSRAGCRDDEGRGVRFVGDQHSHGIADRRAGEASKAETGPASAGPRRVDCGPDGLAPSPHTAARSGAHTRPGFGSRLRRSYSPRVSRAASITARAV